MGGELVLPLRARLAGDPAVVGAKAAGLNLLLRHGFPVPAGYCVLPAAVDAGSASVLRGLPPGFRRAVSSVYGRLGGLVAIRPSGVEQRGVSPALLGVNGEEAVIRAVARSMTIYRGAQAPDNTAFASRPGDFCPVIVQRLVDAVSSGVAYCRNPLTGDATEIVIKASRGLGQPGSTDGAGVDCFRLRKYPLLLLTNEPTVKIREVRAGPVGLVRRPLPQSLRLAPCLSDRQALSLALMVRRVEERVGFPVRVQWALTARGFILLQLDRAADPDDDPFYISPETAGGAGEALRGPDVVEVPPGVISPFAWDFFLRAACTLVQPLLARARLRNVAKTPPIVLVAGRVYLNRSNLCLAIEQSLHLAPGTFAPRDAVSGTGMVARGMSLLRLVLHLLPSLPGFLRYLRRLESERLRSSLGELTDESTRLERVFQEDLTPTQLAATLASVDAFILDRLEVFLGLQIETFRFRRFLRRLRRWCGPNSDAMGARLVAGLGTLDSARPGYVLWELARRIKAAPGLPSPDDPALFLGKLPESAAGREIAAALAEFESVHGHHGLGELDPATPRWGEDSAWIVRELAAFMALPEDAGSLEHARQQASTRSLATAWVEGRLSSGWRQVFFWRRLSLGRYHAKLLALYPLLANTKSALVKLVWRYRRFLLRAGQELCHRGWLECPEEIFLLRADEIHAALLDESEQQQVRAKLKRRAEARASYETLSPPLAIDGLYRLADFAVQTRPGQTTLHGLGVSPGRIRGPACVIHSPGELGLVSPDVVLVAPSVDSGWAPRILRAGAVVTELGGPMSEVAVIAREYGVPAVAKVKGAMACLRDGDLLEVDGETGTVRIVERREDNAAPA